MLSALMGSFYLIFILILWDWGLIKDEITKADNEVLETSWNLWTMGSVEICQQSLLPHETQRFVFMYKKGNFQKARLWKSSLTHTLMKIFYIINIRKIQLSTFEVQVWGCLLIPSIQTHSIRIQMFVYWLEFLWLQ